jgi:hypothetical protein
MIKISVPLFLNLPTFRFPPYTFVQSPGLLLARYKSAVGSVEKPLPSNSTVFIHRNPPKYY